MSWDAVSWARPEWLWALVVVPVAAIAIAWSLRRRRSALETFAEAGVRARTQPLSRGRPALRGTLLTLGLAALCVAAAGPQWGVETVPDPPVRQHVVFALDVSRSMLAEDAAPSRLDRAKLAVRQLLGGLPAAEAGLVVFAGEASLAVPLTRDHAALETSLAESRAKLLEVRGRRPQPARDDKALAAWNGLAIAAFAEAGRLLGEERYTAAAVAAAEAIVGGLLSEGSTEGSSEGSSGTRSFEIEGSPTKRAPAAVSLRRSWKDGRAVGAGVLEDYSHLAEGLLALYETTFDERWFTVARQLADAIIDRFADPAGGFFDTAVDHERLITRPKDPQDNATPSGASMAATVLLRLAAFTGEGRYRDAAERAIGTVAPVMAQYPTAFAQWLVASSFAAGDAVEVAVIGDPAEASTRELLEPVWSTWRPFQVLAAASPKLAPSSAVDLLHDRPPIDGRPAAYVCRDFVCLVPVTTASRLIDQLRATPSA